jgi:aspartyl-tRNA(Asn)/glutamyl-tRNA(Gln) amidotransferase subunit A
MRGMMQDTELAYTSASQLRHLLDSQQVSPVELTELYLRRIEEQNPSLSAFLTITGEEALDSARKAEKEISRGDFCGPLHGIPIAIKDLEITKGIRTTLGSLVFKDTIPDQDSAMVERIRAAGAIILGKTNTPEFGLSGTTSNRLGDECLNPWDTTRTSGGSSGGAGSALAAGMCPIATGTDGGGSIRIPSSFCGVYGIKPTMGRVPRYGGFGRPSPNLTSQAGPMARTVRDATILLQVMAGPDQRDALSLRESVPDFIASLGNGIRELRLAWSPALGYAAVDPEVTHVTVKAAQAFEELGCIVDEPTFGLDDPLPSFVDIFATNAYTSYGHILEEQIEDLTAYAIVNLEHGRRTSGADYARALRHVEVMRALIDDLFQNYDLLLTPTMPLPAFPIGQHPTKIGGKEVNPLWGYLLFNPPFNLTGQPAASVPCGFSAEGLPIGLQIVGRRGDERAVLAASAAFEQVRPWTQHIPK